MISRLTPGEFWQHRKEMKRMNQHFPVLYTQFALRKMACHIPLVSSEPQSVLKRRRRWCYKLTYQALARGFWGLSVVFKKILKEYMNPELSPQLNQTQPIQPSLPEVMRCKGKVELVLIAYKSLSPKPWVKYSRVVVVAGMCRVSEDFSQWAHFILSGRRLKKKQKKKTQWTSPAVMIILK